MATEADVTALVQGIRLARFIAGSPQLDRMRGDETAATAAVVPLPELQAFVKQAAQPLAHQAGTCAMGGAGDKAAVVDATLGVHGVAGLRVAGAAVMPIVVNAPPAPPRSCSAIVRPSSSSPPRRRALDPPRSGSRRPFPAA